MAPTEVIEVKPEACACGQRTFPETRPYHTHQVIELAEIQMVVTHVVLHETCCRQCGRTLKAELPAAYRYGYGPRMTALIGELSGSQRSSRRAVQEFCASVLGVPISRGAIQRAVDRIPAAITPHYEAIATQARQAKVNYIDETAWYQHGVLAWLWVMVNPTVTLFTVQTSRSKAAFEALVERWAGILVSDGYGVYCQWVHARQTCLAHLIHRARGLSERKDPALAGFGRRVLAELRSPLISRVQPFSSVAHDAPRHAFKDYSVTGDAPSAFCATCRIFSSEGHTLRLSSRASPLVSVRACDTRPSALPGDYAPPHREKPAHGGATLLNLAQSLENCTDVCASSQAGFTGLAPSELVNTMSSILFVCTGNILRSLTAEYALKARLDLRSPIRVSSEGTVALPQAMHPDVWAYLMQRGMDPSHHRQRKVSAELLQTSHLVIAMNTDHQAFLIDTFQYQAPLFTEVCHGRSEPLLDVWEAIPTWETDLDAAWHYAFQVMENIWASIPRLLQNLGTYVTVERVE